MKMQLAIIALMFVAKVCSSHVPALVWSSKPDNIQNNLKYSSQIENIEGQEFLSNFVNRNIPVVALVQDSLSVEQFSVNDSPFVSSIFKDTQSQPVSLIFKFSSSFSELVFLLGFLFQYKKHSKILINIHRR